MTTLAEGFDGGSHQVAPEGTFRYDLTPEELAVLEGEMVERARAVADNSLVAAWVNPLHPYANLLRTKEAQKFPEVSAVDDYYERHQKYLALIDTRGEGQVAHAATIMGFDEQTDDNDPSNAGIRTGFYTIDSLIALGNFTRQEFIDYYKSRGVSLADCISVETNFKIHERTERFMGLGTADLTYLTLFNLLNDRNVPKETTILFASINDMQQKSLARNGVESESLLGRTDFATEEADLGKVSVPVAISYLSGYKLLAPLNFRLPEVELGYDDVPTSEVAA